MYKRKDHHYVPQFYLRNFSSNDSRNCVNLYNLKQGKLIPQVSIKEQAKEKYLYGEDDIIESKLSEIESSTAPIIKRIIETERFGSQDDKDQVLRFIMYQYSRIVHREKLMKQQMSALWGTELDDPIMNKGLSVKEMVEMVEEQLPYLQFLDLLLLKNSTDIPFITSDNPVVLYNHLMEKNASMVSAGWANKGLQVIIPLSPDYTLLAYDIFMYKPDKVVSGKDIVRVREQEVKQLNGLQYINAAKNLFFDESMDLEIVKTYIEQYQVKRREMQEPRLISLGSFRLVIGPEIRINLNITGCKLSMAGRRYRRNNRMAEFRHDDFERYRASRDKTVEGFMEDIRKGNSQ